MKQTQSDFIKIDILEALDNGETDKSIIFDMVEANLGVPRPTVRRCSRELLEELKSKVKILSRNWKRPGK